MPNGRTTLSKQITKVDEKADKILAILIGSADNPNQPGLVQRVKSLEDSQEMSKESQTWIKRAIANPLISAIVSAGVVVFVQAIYYFSQIRPLLDKVQIEELIKK